MAIFICYFYFQLKNGFGIFQNTIYRTEFKLGFVACAEVIVKKL
jgi:hypothetical protein